MKSKSYHICAIAAFLTATASGSDWVQWPISQGGNGHWYRAIPTPSGISWTAANAAATAAGAYLATATSAPENAFIYGLTTGCWKDGWGPWLGGFQSGGPEPSGGWAWVTGETWSYSSWIANNPDDGKYSGISENYIHYHATPGNPTSSSWNDWDNGRSGPGYVIERDFTITITRSQVGWINDGRTGSPPGWDRKQYFGDQTIKIPFTIRNDGANAVEAIVTLESARKTSATTHAGNASWASKTQTVTLPAHSETQIPPFNVTVASDGDPGFYDVKAVVELASAPGTVLDTTEPGANNTDRNATAAWIGDSLAFDGNGFCTSDIDWGQPLTNSFMVCRDRPVILIHGITSSPQGCWGNMAKLLTRRDCRAAVSYDYSAFTLGANNSITIPQIAAVFKDGISDIGPGNIPAQYYTINWTKAYFGVEKVDVAAHSMGGIVALLYVSNMADTGAVSVPYGGDIERLITMCSPIWGTDYVRSGEILFNANAPRVQVEAMYPGSDLLWNLNTVTTRPIQHIAVAGGQGNSLAKDPFVSEVSACAPGYAGTSYVAFDYGGDGITDPHNALPKASDESQLGYKIVSAALLGNTMPTDRVKLYGDYNDNSSVVFYRVIDSSGASVKADVAYRSWEYTVPPDFTACLPYPGFKGNFGMGGIEYFWIEPVGAFKRTCAPIMNQPVNMASSKLTMVTFALPAGQDSDGDGWPDHYEAEYPTATSGGAASLLEDTDGDGFNNKLEMWLGTSPQDASSHIRITEIMPAPKADGMEVTIPLETVPGVTYRFQWVTQLGVTWETVETFVGDGSVHQFKRSGIVNPSAFFRFTLEAP